tara:strand:+ start:1703 stop:2641 length:939 start_codon:yes stop_codon:yes gene_type:complete
MSTPALALPDIAQRRHAQPQGELDWVGMSEIHQPILVRNGNVTERAHAKVQIYVDLADPLAKGIHMSRLYLLLDEHTGSHPLSASSLQSLLQAMHRSHLDISERAYVQFKFDYQLRQNALLSENAGWNAYPVTITGTLEDGEYNLELGVNVTYSSTCPCSAALARALIQDAFADRFSRDAPLNHTEILEWLGTEQGIVATPHSQRSVAMVKTRLTQDAGDLPITHLIEALEGALGTPVQTAVKREDEQEFALRNGQNLMFCEDAARKLRSALDAQQWVSDYWLRVEHHESLHAHNAVSVLAKGIAGGYRPTP